MIKRKTGFKWGLALTTSFLIFTGSIPVSAAGTGEFNIGAFEQPQQKPIDYNTNANWANIAGAHIDRMMFIENSLLNGQPRIYNYNDNQNAINNSYANGVDLLVTDSSVYGKYSYTAADKTNLENNILPYKNNPKVKGMALRDEPVGWSIEGIANTYRWAKAFAPHFDFYVNLNPALAGDGMRPRPGKLALSNSGAQGDGSFVTPTQRLGQTFKIPAGMTFLDGIDMYIDQNQWATSETLTLKVWTSTARTTLVGQSSITGIPSTSDTFYSYPYFSLKVPVTAGATYYMELTHGGGGDNSVGWVVRSTSSVYADGAAYVNGVAQSNDFFFRIYKNRDSTSPITSTSTGNGDYVSRTYGLGQTFTTPASVNRRAYYIEPFIDASQWTSGQPITLTLWDSPAKTRMIEKTGPITSTNNGDRPRFFLYAKLTPNTTYYYELTSSSNTNLGWVVKSTSNTYSGGTGYRTTNNSDTAITYSGAGWGVSTGRGYGDFSDDVHYTTANNSYFEYTFTGTGVDYVTEKSSDQGDVDIYIDNVFQQTVSTYNATRQIQQTVYSKTGLTNGSHTIKVVKKSGSYMLLDSIRVQQATDYSFRVVFGSQYEDYVDDFLDISGANELQFDNYPFRGGYDDPTYFQNAELIRERGLDHDVIYGAFLQSATIHSGSGHVKFRSSTPSMKRYNVYTYLTYGMKNMYWFTYWQPEYVADYDETFSETPVSLTGQLQDAYWQIQALNLQMKNLGGTLKDLTSTAVYHGGERPYGTIAFPVNYSSSFYVKPVDLNQPIIEGFFINASGRKYVMLTDRDYSVNKTYTFQFNPANKPSSLTEISKSTGLEVSTGFTYNATTGQLTINMLPGEGRLFALPVGY